MTRDKRDCMHIGTGLCPRNEGWGDHEEPCDDCKYYLTREGERDGPAGETER